MSYEMFSEQTCSGATVKCSNRTIRGDNNIINGNCNRVIGSQNQVLGNRNRVEGNLNTVKGSHNRYRGWKNDVTGDFNEPLKDKPAPKEKRKEKRKEKKEKKTEKPEKKKVPRSISLSDDEEKEEEDLTNIVAVADRARGFCKTEGCPRKYVENSYYCFECNFNYGRGEKHKGMCAAAGCDEEDLVKDTEYCPKHNKARPGTEFNSKSILIKRPRRQFATWSVRSGPANNEMCSKCEIWKICPAPGTGCCHCK